MKKTKFWLVIFALLLVGAVIGSVLILGVSNNQAFDEFELIAVDEYDLSAIGGISFNVEYRMKEEGEHHFYDMGDKCEFIYDNGAMKDIRYTEVNDTEEPFEIFIQYESVGEDRRVGLCEDEGFYFFSVKYAYGLLPDMRNISAEIPKELFNQDGQYKYQHDKKFWSVGDDYYFFENGALFTVDETTLCDIKLYGYDDQRHETLYYPVIYTVPDEVDAIIGCEGGEYMHLVGIGNATEKGYTLFSYVIDVFTGATIDRQCYEKDLVNSVTDVNKLSFDYLTTDENYSVVTITQPMGEQDMYVISHTDTKSTVEYFDTDKMVAGDLYISGLLEAKSNGSDTLCLIYAESQIGKTDYDIEWAKRVIMNLEDRMPVALPKGYESYRDVGYNGVAFVVIKNDGIAYKGYFSSETSKTLGHIIHGCMSGQGYRDIHGYDGVFVENIEINMQ